MVPDVSLISPLSRPRQTCPSGGFRALIPGGRAPWRHLLAACLSCSILLSASLAHGEIVAERQVQDGQVVRYVKGRLLVQPRAGVGPLEFEKILKPLGARAKARLGPLNVHVIELPAQASEMAVAQVLARHPHIKFAELDRAVEPAQTPNDPALGSAWHLPKIGATTAWDHTVGEGVTIAILDTGVDGSHPDLSPHLVAGWNFYDNNAITSDVYGHGTKVAGAAAAVGNNALGSAGVSWRSTLMPLRVTDSQGYGYYSLMAQALVWAADHGARVANISFLSVSSSSTVREAAQYFRNKGGVVVVAGGNTGGELSDPASDAITAVAATDGSDNRTSWSSWGKHIDVAAPGVSIYTTTRGGGYGGFSGTSASSPVTAGVYALMMAANPRLDPASLDRTLFETAVDRGSAGYDLYYGYGRVDAAAAVSAAQARVANDTQPPSVAITSPTGGKVSGLVPVDVSASDNGGVARVELYAGDRLVGTETTAPYRFAWDTSALPDGEISLQAKAVDGSGNAASSTRVSVTVANDTVAPRVSFSSPADGATVSGTVNVSVSATDDKKVAKLSLVIDGKEVAVAYGSTLSYAWDTGTGKAKGKGKGRSANTSSPSTLTARAEDPAGNVGSASITVQRQ